MFQFTIRAAKHSDAEAVCRIAGTVLNSELPPDMLKRLYAKIIEDVEQIVMVAINSAHTVGFIHARQVKDLVLGKYTEIAAIALLPYYQKRGGGTSLLLGAEQWSRQMLTSKLKCIPKNDVTAIKQLLTVCGYEENVSGVLEKIII